MHESSVFISASHFHLLGSQKPSKVSQVGRSELSGGQIPKGAEAWSKASQTFASAKKVPASMLQTWPETQTFPPNSDPD